MNFHGVCLKQAGLITFRLINDGHKFKPARGKLIFNFPENFEERERTSYKRSVIISAPASFSF